MNNYRKLAMRISGCYAIGLLISILLYCFWINVGLNKTKTIIRKKSNDNHVNGVQKRNVKIAVNKI